MEPNVIRKPPNIKTKPLEECKIRTLDVDHSMKMNESDCITSLSSPLGTSKVSPNEKSSCLCSPTTHAGSFRCRHHRGSSSSPVVFRAIHVASTVSESGGKNDSNEQVKH